MLNDTSLQTEDTYNDEVSSIVWAAPNTNRGSHERDRANSSGNNSAGGRRGGGSDDGFSTTSGGYQHGIGDSFDWGPITLSSISPISIVHGRPIETLQLMRTVREYD